MESSIPLYSLLFDKSPLVRAWAFDSFSKIGIDGLPFPIVKNLLREMIEFTSKDCDSDTMMVIAFFVKKVCTQAEDISGDVQEFIAYINDNLLNSKYFSVRIEIKEIKWNPASTANTTLNPNDMKIKAFFLI